MSLQDRSPIRVADLPEQVYTPRVPNSPLAKAYEESVKEQVATVPEASIQKASPLASPSSSKPEELSPEAIELIRRYKEDSTVRQYFEQVLASPLGYQPPPTTNVWGIDFHVVDMEQTLAYLEQVIRDRKPRYAITANLNYAMLCSKHPRLAAFTKNSALTLCDGMPVLWRSRLNGTKLPERVAGADLIFRLSERCAQKKFRIYLYGAADGVAEKTAAKLKELYPNLIISGVQCPPFRACSPEEIQIQIESIKRSKPDVLLVALGQPKGEYWIEDHLEKLGIPLTIQLGASFDFVAGNSHRAPKIWQKLGLEWLHRTLQDPKRLAPRYFANLLFLLQVTRQELIQKLS